MPAMLWNRMFLQISQTIYLKSDSDSVHFHLAAALLSPVGRDRGDLG